MSEDHRVEVVLANNDRVTLRSGEMFIKVDGNPERSAREVEALRLAPVPTPEILWHRPLAFALAAVPGKPLGDPATSPAAWRSVGAALARLHASPLPPWRGPSLEDRRKRLDEESRWLVDHHVLDEKMVWVNRRLAESALRRWRPVFVHGDLHAEHVFVDGDSVSGIIDWSEASRGDALFDLALITLTHPERLDDLLVGYGTDVDRSVIRGWQAWRCLTSIRWLVENGYGEPHTYPEVNVLRGNV